MQTLTRVELKRLQEKNEDFLLLNVLSPESFQKAHIPGSCNIPVATEGFLNKVEQAAGAKGKSRRIVTYCGGSHCSASKDAAHLLEGAGFGQVQAFEGGMEDWIAAGYPVESGDAQCGKTQCAA